LIDYAGVFPPAALPLEQALANYERYRASPEAWMLGRFVLPVGQAVAPAEPWPFTAILSGDLGKIPHGVDTVEIKASNAANVTAYFEITNLALLPTIRAVGARAKIRAGGVTTEMFPDVAHIGRFLEVCAQENVAFKATAGLHHPLRCYRPLTYAADGPSGWMYGFLNVFTAAVLARRGVTKLEPILLAESAEELPQLDDVGEITRVRRDFAISFGSCSFEEPVADLKALHLI
jgi:hypothetical protein